MKKIFCLLLVMVLFVSFKKVESSSPSELKFTLKNGVSFKMIKVDGGTFQMGSYDWETPVHSVTLSDYYIGETEVTQALWQTVMGNNPSKWKDDDYPVGNVSWDDCQMFITKLNKMTGRRFALPTEAQWEFAARGGNKSRGYKYSGSDDTDHVAWCWTCSASFSAYIEMFDYESDDFAKTVPVGKYRANELGLHDMSGNVEEWCADWYGDYSSSSQTDPTGPSTGSRRVIRGGSWTSYLSDLRSTSRHGYEPNSSYHSSGLRLVLLSF